MRIQTIYPAFMGEVNKFGIGAPCVFVRTAGCNLRCYWKTLGMYCDTPEALKITSGKEMTADSILQEVNKYRIRLVCLTGGEPLCQPVKGLKELFSLFKDNGINVVVETNGSMDVSNYLEFPNVSFVVDYKVTSTGEQPMMFFRNFDVLREDDWVKFVLYNESDIDEMLKVCKDYPTKARLAAGLFWGSERLCYGADGLCKNNRLLEHIVFKHPELNIHLNVQAHKLICLYDNDIEATRKIIVPRDL